VKDDGTTPWVLQYRASVGDTPTPALDQTILAAAGRHSARRRTVRNIKGASFIGIFAMLAISAVWHVRPLGSYPHTATDYGRFEGISRRYLQEVQTHQFNGYGVAEGRP
jgi:hypothetical protein